MEAILEELEKSYELPGKEHDDAGALMLAIEHANALTEISVDVNGQAQQRGAQSIEVFYILELVAFLTL